MLYSIYSAEERAPEITHHVVGGRNLKKIWKQLVVYTHTNRVHTNRIYTHEPHIHYVLHTIYININTYTAPRKERHRLLTMY